jgi:hypothetical protein
MISAACPAISLGFFRSLAYSSDNDGQLPR